ncbi:hypothetical protein N0V82_010414 [Gnomoniopsis sp. IMI 355080]|nr:hypothetical protein N0V82_010414 [Gnomoniopsis sp. IMI 355080]
MSQQDVSMGDDGSSHSEYSETDSHVSMTREEFDKDPGPKDAQSDAITELYANQRLEDYAHVLRLQWRERPPDAQENWQCYVPDWTRPGYDPRVRFTMNGKYTRAATDAEERAMRPTLLPGDQEARTDYTLLLVRDKWIQTPYHANSGGNIAINPSDDHEIISLAARYNIGGEDAPYDAAENDKVWNALEPCLRLATKIIESDPPYWDMILDGLFHLRKVPRERDGRTDAEKNDPNYRELPSLWYDIDEDQMYSEAKNLMDIGFDCRKFVYGVLVRGT